MSGANHRELGRGTSVHPDMASVLQVIEEVRGLMSHAVLSFVIAPTGGRWIWRMTVDGASFAMSSRSYFRQRECAYAAAAFSAAIGVATLPSGSGRRNKPAHMNDRRTPHDQVGYVVPSPTDSLDPTLSVDLGRTPS